MRDGGAAVRAAPGRGRRRRPRSSTPAGCWSSAPGPARRRGASGRASGGAAWSGIDAVAGACSQAARVGARPGPRASCIDGRLEDPLSGRPRGISSSPALRCITWTAIICGRPTGSAATSRSPTCSATSTSSFEIGPSGGVIAPAATSVPSSYSISIPAACSTCTTSIRSGWIQGPARAAGSASRVHGQPEAGARTPPTRNRRSRMPGCASDAGQAAVARARP